MAPKYSQEASKSRGDKAKEPVSIVRGLDTYAEQKKAVTRLEIMEAKFLTVGGRDNMERREASS